MASVRGWQLKRWRYGADTDSRVEAALEREGWSAEQWASWRAERLGRLLHRAATEVPYYRDQWKERRRRGDQAAWDDVRNWPVLRKEVLRERGSEFVRDGCDRRRMFVDHTSGTTGTPLTLWFSGEAVREWYALFEARTRRWHGVTRLDRWGLLGGQPVVPPRQMRPPFWVWNAGLNQLYLSAMHISSASAESYLHAIRDYGLQFMVGYPSSLKLLADEAKRLRFKLPLRAVITNAEPLHARQRAVMEEGFGCEIQETYGLAETVCMATQCRDGTLHLWPEAGVTEVLDEFDRPVSPGTPGRIVSTGLVNGDMPLIRYDTRDRGELDEDDRQCACGRNLPRLKRVWGRWDDVILTADGRRPVLLDRIFDPPVRVKEGQIVQRAIGRFLLRVVPAEHWGPEDAALLKEALLGLVGPAEVEVELVPKLERTWAGKARIIISELPQDVS